MKAGPIEKVLQALDELGKIIKAQESLIADKDRRIDESRLENKALRRYEKIRPLVKIFGLTIDELTDELKWVYDNCNEQHILDRVAKIVPPEDR